MTLVLHWPDIALRLGLILLAGAIVGLNRGEHGRAAGLRTTMLVCLAAGLAMIEANLLLDTPPTPPNSPLRLDVMRLPLGILTGIGFIGAGAILRRGDMVLGVTTAATIWFVTVLGICFGGGQIWLGLAALGLGLFVLWILQWVEPFIHRDRLANLTVATSAKGPPPEEIERELAAAGFKIASHSVAYSDQAQTRELQYEVKWRSRYSTVPGFLPALAKRPGVLKLEWQPQGPTKV
jgi:putative Mg2+ transporter-C (MgtC) family protein